MNSTHIFWKDGCTFVKVYEFNIVHKRKVRAPIGLLGILYNKLKAPKTDMVLIKDRSYAATWRTVYTPYWAGDAIYDTRHQDLDAAIMAAYFRRQT